MTTMTTKPKLSKPKTTKAGRTLTEGVDFKVRDLSLAELGRKEIRLAEHEMPGLMALRDRRPFTTTPEEVERLAGTVADRNFRIEVTAQGIHAYNRDGHHVAQDPFDLFPHLKVEDDGAHALYLGVETARAEIAYRLGKRYAQDEPLRWGVAGETGGSADEAHRLTFKEAGSTLSAKKKGDSA